MISLHLNAKFHHIKMNVYFCMHNFGVVAMHGLVYGSSSISSRLTLKSLVASLMHPVSLMLLKSYGSKSNDPKCSYSCEGETNYEFLFV